MSKKDERNKVRESVVGKRKKEEGGGMVTLTRSNRGGIGHGREGIRKERKGTREEESVSKEEEGEERSRIGRGTVERRRMVTLRLANRGETGHLKESGRRGERRGRRLRDGNALRQHPL